MAKSMTGYGRAELQQGDYRFTAELKSVNNRYLDLNIRMPRQLAPFEAQVRTVLKQRILRGKVDVFISYENVGESGVHVRCNRALAAEYAASMQEMARDLSLPFTLTAEQLSGFPNVLTVEETDTENNDLAAPLLECVGRAAEAFTAARAREGAFITEDLLKKLDGLQTGVEQIREKGPAIVEQYRKGLYERMQEVLKETGIEETRILQEAALYADRICVDEEMVRLESHIQAVRAELVKEDESVGRKLDFLVQEMNREANTILSKTSNAESADIAIELKTEIEKIREQIQNME